MVAQYVHPMHATCACMFVVVGHVRVCTMCASVYAHACVRRSGQMSALERVNRIIVNLLHVYVYALVDYGMCCIPHSRMRILPTQEHHPRTPPSCTNPALCQHYYRKIQDHLELFCLKASQMVSFSDEDMHACPR